MPALNISVQWLWAVIYILLVTLIWPLAVLLISIPFGQFTFFSNYLRKIGRRMGIGERRTEDGGRRTEDRRRRTEDGGQRAEAGAEITRIAIFASGAGSNAQKIIQHFNNNPQKTAVRVGLIVCNNPQAGIVQIARQENIPVLLLEKMKFMQGDGYAPEILDAGIDFIVLAGFLWKLPLSLIKAYPGAIINIHPALLPKYGGKGMYGRHVHNAVLANKEKESGITIHYVDEIYDHGSIIQQATCPVLENDTADTLAFRVQELEHAYYPEVISNLLQVR
jgi:formyltetrahydrofolate-dependent phosphoribosylglycinamide formyltransferase